MADPTKLYTTRVLELATGLAEWPWNAAMPLQASVRSRSCGSRLDLGLDLADGRIGAIALKSQACAIGQASAAIFARHAVGRSADDIALAADQVRDWLAGERELPDWPGMDAISAARDYPGRHGAILLPWQAARQLLPTG